MTLDRFDYQQMVQDALRGMVRRALHHVEEHGLPGVHHFYITYDTTRRGVVLSPELAAKYPEQITIVLQHDYRDLEVEEDRFSVTLHFGGLPQRIVVPYRALLAFYDPTEQFVLRFELDEEDEIPDPADGPVLAEEAPVGSLRRPVRAVLAAADRLQAVKEATEGKDAADSGEDSDSEKDSPAVEPAAALAPDLSSASAEAEDPSDESEAAPEKVAEKAAEADEKSKDKTGNVVSIDAFRRK